MDNAREQNRQIEAARSTYKPRGKRPLGDAGRSGIKRRNRSIELILAMEEEYRIYTTVRHLYPNITDVDEE